MRQGVKVLITLLPFPEAGPGNVQLQRTSPGSVIRTGM